MFYMNSMSTFRSWFLSQDYQSEKYKKKSISLFSRSISLIGIMLMKLEKGSKTDYNHLKTYCWILHIRFSLLCIIRVNKNVEEKDLVNKLPSFSSSYHFYYSCCCWLEFFLAGSWSHHTSDRDETSGFLCSNDAENIQVCIRTAQLTR